MKERKKERKKWNEKVDYLGEINPENEWTDDKYTEEQRDRQSVESERSVLTLEAWVHLVQFV